MTANRLLISAYTLHADRIDNVPVNLSVVSPSISKMSARSGFDTPMVDTHVRLKWSLLGGSVR
jgi:hypothetical protein